MNRIWIRLRPEVLQNGAEKFGQKSVMAICAIDFRLWSNMTNRKWGRRRPEVPQNNIEKLD